MCKYSTSQKRRSQDKIRLRWFYCGSLFSPLHPSMDTFLLNCYPLLNHITYVVSDLGGKVAYGRKVSRFWKKWLGEPLFPKDRKRTMLLTVRLFLERVHKNSPRAGQKRTLGKHLAPHGDENCRNGLHITKPCTPKWGEHPKFCQFFRLKWGEISI
jgi:hypothetical protein